MAKKAINQQRITSTQQQKEQAHIAKEWAEKMFALYPEMVHELPPDFDGRAHDEGCEWHKMLNLVLKS